MGAGQTQPILNQTVLNLETEQEKKKRRKVQKELAEAKEEIVEMDMTIKDGWRELKEEQQIKRYAQKELRDERAASQELVRHYSAVERELQAFRSNREGYIKRQEYNIVKQQLEKQTTEFH